jgi:prepilin-type N-terminal cleavage/methylation domain-containing protein
MRKLLQRTNISLGAFRGMAAPWIHQQTVAPTVKQRAHMQLHDFRPAPEAMSGRLDVRPAVRPRPTGAVCSPRGRATRSAQSGFTLMELMMVVAIVGLLMTFGVETYQGAMVKAHIADALSLVAPQKLTIVENITSNAGANACVGVTDILVKTSSVERTQCTDDGSVASVHVEMGPEAGSLVVSMVNNRNSPTLWVCVPDPAFADYKYLPSSCRN